MPEQVQEKARNRAEEKLGELNVPFEFMSQLLREHASSTFRKGEALFLRGSTADVLYWVVSGLVKICCPTPDGGSVLVGMAGPGDFIGFIDTTESGDRRFQAFEGRAMTKTNVAIFTRDRVRTILKTLNADDLISLIENVNTGWSVFCRHWIRLSGLPIRGRLRATLQDLAVRFGARESRGILLMITVSHDELAAMIASSRPRVTKLIAELVREGFIARQGRHYILLNSIVQNSSNRNRTDTSPKASTLTPPRC